jgi:hypothetical protein
MKARPNRQRYVYKKKFIPDCLPRELSRVDSVDTDRLGRSEDTSGSDDTETNTPGRRAPGSEVAVRPGRAATASLSEVAGRRVVTSSCGAGVTVSSGIRAGWVTEVSGSAGGRAGTPGSSAEASGKPGSNANSGSPGTRGSSPSGAGTPVDRAELYRQ